MADARDPRPPLAIDPAHEHLVERMISTECVFEGRLLHVRSDTIRLPDGGTATREYIVHPGAVLVVPMFDDGSFVVERQFRYPHNRVFLEFPAGKLDPPESPLACGQRELREEAGYVAREWTRLGTVHSILAYSTEAIEVFLAEGLSHVGAALDDGEFLEVGRLSHDEMLAALDRGEITDSKTIAALMLADRRLRPAAGR